MVGAYERAADAAGDTSCQYTLRRLLDPGNLGREIHQGLQNIVNSYQGLPLTADLLADRSLVLFWSREAMTIQLAEDYADYFAENHFTLKSLEPVKAFMDQLPQELAGKAKQVCVETVFYLACKESKLWDDHSRSFEGQRFRLYLQELENQNINPLLFYDYRGSLQSNIERAEDLHAFTLSNADLREFDFRHKSLTGMKIEGSDLRRAKLQNCIVSKAEFINCDLSGVDFTKSNLKEAKFTGCFIDRTIFNEATLNSARFIQCRFHHPSFIQSDLSEAKFEGGDLYHAYFHKTKLSNVLFEIVESYEENVFRMCDLQGAKFMGENSEGETGLRYCDFRNSNLIGCQFAVDIIAYSNFVKAQLNNADFSQGDLISGCDFRFCQCFAMNLAGLTVEECDFSFGDLSGLKVKSGIRFVDNEFPFANLSRYDFTTCGYWPANDLTHADLSNTQMADVDFSASPLSKVNLSGAKLKNTKFTADQLEEISLTYVQRQEIQIVRVEQDEDLETGPPGEMVVATTLDNDQ